MENDSEEIMDMTGFETVFQIHVKIDHDNKDAEVKIEHKHDEIPNEILVGILESFINHLKVKQDRRNIN